MRDPYRIAVAAPGGLGACAIRELTHLKDYELVAVLAYSSSKYGVDAGELGGINPLGLKTTTDFQSLLDSDAECVVYTARDFGDWRADVPILALLEAGKNADQLEIGIDRIERTSHHQLAPTAIVTPATMIAPGTTGCVSYAWTAYSADKPFYTTEVYWFLGDVIRPAAARSNDFWTVEIEGRFSLKLSVKSQASYAESLYVRPREPAPAGYLPSVVAMVQAIPAEIDAAPGCLMPSLPQFHWKFDQRGSL